ncbi:hypothetical protein [Flavobacterium sp. GT3P67]|uniref:hypothetical protein n=1 Tax=Flavobacterium sp. GT3P67 TaxID=2541722 RepID=UPI001044BFD6|nr:hypothetical protein [Flavobacterium sp. GT3P67]TDE53075.1 hypothetical protein E0H99_10380 [Flavobacterium sp. GT3P67]
MKTKKKYLALLVFLMGVININNLQAQTFEAKDMDGMWERNDGVRISIDGTAVFAEGSKALIFAVGNSGWPTNSIQYNFKFKNITHNGDNTWNAGNQAYSKGTSTWQSSGNVTMTMNKDKSAFNCGGFTYSRKSLIH